MVHATLTNVKSTLSHDHPQNHGVAQVASYRPLRIPDAARPVHFAVCCVCGIDLEQHPHEAPLVYEQIDMLEVRLPAIPLVLRHQGFSTDEHGCCRTYKVCEEEKRG